MDRAAAGGLLVMDKPAGMTSREALDAVARPLKKAKHKVGHCGTLDPLATGVLVVAVGPATRLVEYVQRMGKTYRALLRLGAVSDTLDADGRVAERPGAADPGLDAVKLAAGAQVGGFDQMPPAYSARKVDGRRAYDLARQGAEVALQASAVTIDRVEILAYDWPMLDLEIDCGGGTYIRSVARDIGEALGVGGLIQTLRRTRIGGFGLEGALDPRTLDPESIPRLLRPMALAVEDLPRATLDAEQLARVARGMGLDPSRLGLDRSHGEVALFGPDGTLAAVAEIIDGEIRPRRVLVRVSSNPGGPAAELS